MGAGKYNRRIVVQRFTSAQDAYGEMIETWSTYATIWAKKTDTSDGERFRLAEVSATISTRFLVRYTALTKAMTPKDRISFDGEIFDILGIKETERRKELEISTISRAD